MAVISQPNVAPSSFTGIQVSAHSARINKATLIKILKARSVCIWMNEFE